MTSFNSKAQWIRNRLLEFCSLMAFQYGDLEFDIDPFNPEHFHIACNGSEWDVDSIDMVMEGKFFNGHSLNEIADVVDITDW